MFLWLASTLGTCQSVIDVFISLSIFRSDGSDCSVPLIFQGLPTGMFFSFRHRSGIVPLFRPCFSGLRNERNDRNDFQGGRCESDRCRKMRGLFNVVACVLWKNTILSLHYCFSHHRTLFFLFCEIPSTTKLKAWANYRPVTKVLSLSRFFIPFVPIIPRACIFSVFRRNEGGMIILPFQPFPTLAWLFQDRSGIIPGSFRRFVLVL